MYRKLKAYVTAGLLSIFGAHGVQAAETAESPDSLKVERITPESPDQLQDSLAKELKITADKLGLDVTELSRPTLADSIYSDTALINKLSQMTKLELDKFCLIFHWEDFRPVPYQLKGKNINEKFFTYSVGITHKEDGSKIVESDTIKVLEELFDSYKPIEKEFDEKINACFVRNGFSVENFSEGEQLALFSLVWNCGPGTLKSMVPSLREYCKLRQKGEENMSARDKKRYAIIKYKLEQAFMERCHDKNGKIISGVQKRRKFEWLIFSGQVKVHNRLYIDKETADMEEPLAPDEVDLFNSSVGAAGGSVVIGRKNVVEKVCNKVNNCKYGTNVADTIRTQFTDLYYPKVEEKVKKAEEEKQQNKKNNQANKQQRNRRNGGKKGGSSNSKRVTSGRGR
jgi:hypothetical protein